LRAQFSFKGLIAGAQATFAGVYDSNQPIEPYIKKVIDQWGMPDSIRDMGLGDMTISL